MFTHCYPFSNGNSLQVLPDPTTYFKPDATYFLIGCLDGLGRSLIRHIYSHGARYFHLLSRSTSSAPASILQDFPDATFTITRGDVANLEVIQSALSHLSLSTHPIKGVFHAVMVLHDSPFTNLTPTMLSDVLSPKILGARNLDSVFSSAAGKALDFFLITSSITGNLGAQMQSN